MTELISENTRGNSDLRLERDSIHQQYNDKVTEVEEVRKLRDQLAKKVKLKDKKVQVCYKIAL